MKLYYMPGACSMTPHTALEWIGQPYEAQSVDRREIKSPEYLKLNPQGAVPLLVDGDLALSQNAAILAYLDARFPQARLFGSDDLKGKARAWRWLAFLNADVHKAFSPLFHLPDYVRDEAVKTAMQTAARDNIRHLLAQADAQLAAQPYLGDGLSVADVYLYVLLRWCRSLQLDLADLPRLAPFYARLGENAGVRSVITQENLKP
mgnify:FL=1